MLCAAQSLVYGKPAGKGRDAGGSESDDDDDELFKLKRSDEAAPEQAVLNDVDGGPPLPPTPLLFPSCCPVRLPPRAPWPGGRASAWCGNPGGCAGFDCCRSAMSGGHFERWEEGALDPEALRDRFVTGDWAKGEARAALRPEEAGSEGGGGDGEEVYGDFEDVESGAKFSGAGGGGDDVTNAALHAIKVRPASPPVPPRASHKGARRARLGGR